MTKQKQFFYLFILFPFLNFFLVMEHKLIENMNKQKDNVAYIKYPHYLISYGTKKYCICDGETFINLNFKSLLMMPSRLIYINIYMYTSFDINLFHFFFLLFERKSNLRSWSEKYEFTINPSFGVITKS